MGWFQSIGIVFALLVVMMVTVLTMYIGYILAIGTVLIALVFIVHFLIKATQHKSQT